MDAQAKIFEMLKDTRIRIEAAYVIIRYEAIQTIGASETMLTKLDQERDSVLAELDKRIEAHPLYEPQK